VHRGQSLLSTIALFAAELDVERIAVANLLFKSKNATVGFAVSGPNAGINIVSGCRRQRWLLISPDLKPLTVDCHVRDCTNDKFHTLH